MNRTGRIPFGLISGGMAVAVLIFSRIAPASGLFLPCAFKSLFGFPCPSCGAGRALGEFSAGRVAEAFTMNPLFSLLLIVAAAGFIIDIVAIAAGITRPVAGFDSKDVKKLKIAALFLFFLNWMYVIVIGR